MRSSRIIPYRPRQICKEGIELRRCRKVHRLIQIIIRGVISLREPRTPRLVLRRSRRPAKLHRQSRHARLYKAVLVRAYERVAVRLRIAGNLNVVRRANRPRLIAQ